MIRFLVMLFLLHCLGCKSILVGDLRKEFAGKNYVRTADAANYRVDVRYVPKLRRVIERAGLQDSVRLKPRLMDSLNKSAMPGGILFVVSIRAREQASKPDANSDLNLAQTLVGSRQDGAIAFNTGLKDRIWIEEAGYRIPISHHHVENAFEVSDGYTLLVSFPEFKSKDQGVRRTFDLVLDDIVPGLPLHHFKWDLPIGDYDENI